ncbi:Family of unknown function [Olivibacter domesticus]|uniref:Translocation and assembly module TamB C-terminal domain-containing protein n=1 Tax=Olivibacter domesticus TaxID=407022 RepID=A0A1H7Z2P7_OLID1|nr:Family of unknown function [Olivibacter domesticus]
MYVFTSTLVLVIALLFALQFKAVQTFISQRVATYLSNELNTKIKIEGVYFKPFSSLLLEKVLIEDLDHDTLLYAEELRADLNLRGIRNRKISIEQLTLSKTSFYLKKQLDSTSNLTFLIRYFSSPKKEEKEGSFVVNLNKLSLRDINFSYKNLLNKAKSDGINFNDIAVYHLNGDLTDIDVENHLIKARIKNAYLKEKSGFELKKLNALAIVDSNRMEFSKLHAVTNSSNIGDYLRFDYKDISDFSDFIESVNVLGVLKNARINSKDIAYFAPSVNITKFDVGLNGVVKGKVGNFSGKKMLIKTGKTTYLKGDVHIVGLPDIDETIFDLDLEQLSSNYADLGPIITGFSGKNNLKLPEFIETLGHFNYAGKVRGKYYQFQLQGALKSSVGMLKTDLAINLKDNYTYQGELETDNLDVGKLFQNTGLGDVSFVSRIDGHGATMDALSADIDASIRYLEYKGYSYENLTMDGQVGNRLIQGAFTIKDKNLIIDANGSVNLQDDLPLITVQAVMEKIDLREIGLFKDSLTAQGNVNAEFQGNNLNNIIGAINLKGLVLRKPSYTTAIDSIVLAAKGMEDKRVISVKSDIADIVMNGEIDLNAFPAYFKSIAKRHIPSWKADLNPGEQSFDFALTLKRSEPLTELFAPSIKVPDTVVVNGKFSTIDHIANLNGYIPMLEIGKIKVKDVILDEVAMDESLNLTLTADRVNITDSLYVDNINISNILSNDSLRFNVKLSDIDAKNQLDLNGLVEFNSNEAATLSLLPSNVVINKEEWKLEDKVNFDFHEGNIHVKGFELANGDQHVHVDGLISNKETDVLDVKFEKFDLVTLAGLTNPLGIELKGTLNGDLQVYSLLKNPYVSADVSSSDIFYNDREIGDMVLKADMDPVTDLVGMNMEITRQEVKTLKITGEYNAKAATNSLNLHATLDDSEIVLFEPFLKNLVSDLVGSVSADIDITGTPFNPVISGDCQFNKTSFTVNYLKTRYTINDKVSVHNSTIELQELTVLDQNNNKAIANGSVDMSKPTDPTINVRIKATNFMVLNTTAKDNALYYGTGIGTGDFNFKGPTSNMDIDIKASTEEGTIFNIPLNAAGTVSENDFITFVSKDSTFSKPKNSYFDGLTLHIDLDIKRNAEANIFTDLGKLSGSGNGNITMNVTSLGDFEMFGDYVILQGKFTFTAQDFINKIFEISRGGTIRWTGNPSDALINLTAVYEVRTSVRPLYVAAGRAGTDQRVVAQAEMMLGGNLLHPEISFAIDFPTDSYVKDELQNYLSDANNINQQALSLIVRRSFAPGTGTDLTTELNSTFLSAGTELAFNQLNNIIAQSLNLNFVDFNIRSFNEASASIRLLNNRLILTGGVTDRRSELNDLNLFSNQVASDVEALYVIRKNGNLLFRASNRLNNRNFLNPDDEYVSALGLVYRQEFDTLGEFFRRMFMLNRKKRKEEETPSPIPNTEEDNSPVKGSKVN